jgi:hypothetical protein
MLVNRSDPFLPLESKIFDQLFRRRKNGKDSKAKTEKMGSYGTFKDEDVFGVDVVIEAQEPLLV